MEITILHIHIYIQTYQYIYTLYSIIFLTIRALDNAAGNMKRKTRVAEVR